MGVSANTSGAIDASIREITFCGLGSGGGGGGGGRGGLGSGGGAAAAPLLEARGISAYFSRLFSTNHVIRFLTTLSCVRCALAHAEDCNILKKRACVGPVYVRKAVVVPSFAHDE